MTNPKLLELEDSFFLKKLSKMTDWAIAGARNEVEQMIDQVEPLCEARELPEHLCRAYNALLVDLNKVARPARKMDDKFRHLALMDAFLDSSADTCFIASTVEDARSAISRINALERRLKQTVDDLVARLHASPLPLARWKAAFVNMAVSFQLDPSLERQCFKEAARCDQLKLIVSFSRDIGRQRDALQPDDGPSATEFQWMEGHPLRGVRMGWMVRKLLEDTDLPWPLLGRVRTIDAELSVNAYRTLHPKTQA